MFKRLFLCLLLTTDLYPVEHETNDKILTTFITAVVIGAGAVVISICSLNSEEFEELITQINSGDTEKIGKILNFGLLTAGAVIGVFALPDLYSMSKEMYEHTFPTEEQKSAQQADAITAAANIKYYDARVKFRNCLMKHKSGCEKNSSSCPTACEELAQNFRALGHQDEVDRMIKSFNGFGQ